MLTRRERRCRSGYGAFVIARERWPAVEGIAAHIEHPTKHIRTRRNRQWAPRSLDELATPKARRIGECNGADAVLVQLSMDLQGDATVNNDQLVNRREPAQELDVDDRSVNGDHSPTSALVGPRADHDFARILARH